MTPAPFPTLVSDDAFVRFMGALAVDPKLWTEFQALCDFGGRLTGSAGERAARDWAAVSLAAIPGGTLRRKPARYAGWTCRHARLQDLRSERDLDIAPLLAGATTPPEGLELEVVDCGRGSPEQIAAAGVRGKAALVRHEYPFASWTIHRRIKLAAAIEAGAAAFLIVQPEPGIGPVSGSAGAATAGRMIPGLGLSAEAAARIATAGSRVRVTVLADELPDAPMETMVLDLPGEAGLPSSDNRVVLSAHIDGHAMGDSALDNATGVAAALALARAVAPFMAGMVRGVTVCLFSAEEWALTGSRVWLETMAVAERARIVFNLNLDSIAGAPSLTALTSGFTRLGPFVQGAADAAGLSLGVHVPLMTNSDHANFAVHGIPALRLLAGFDEPSSNLRYLLTRADTALLTDPLELKATTLTAGAVLWRALRASQAEIAALSARTD